MIGENYAFVASVVFVAAVCQGLSGFGFALILVPLLSLVGDVKLAVVLGIILGTLVNVFLSLPSLRWVKGWVVGWLSAGSLLGMPLGAFLLLRLDVLLLKLLIGLLVIFFSLLLFRTNIVLNLPGGRLSHLLVGAASGALSTSTAMSGPPVVFFLVSHQMEKKELRGTLVVFFTIVGFISTVILFRSGVMGEQTLPLILATMPSLAIGALVGRQLCKRVTQQTFRRITLILMLLTGLVSLSTSILNWILKF